MVGSSGRTRGMREVGGSGWYQTLLASSLARVLLCILLFWLANIQDGRRVILGSAVCVSSRRPYARVGGGTSVGGERRRYAWRSVQVTHRHTRAYLCTGNSVYRAMHGAMHIYA